MRNVWVVEGFGARGGGSMVRCRTRRDLSSTYMKLQPEFWTGGLGESHLHLHPASTIWLLHPRALGSVGLKRSI